MHRTLSLNRAPSLRQPSRSRSFSRETLNLSGSRTSSKRIMNNMTMLLFTKLSSPALSGTIVSVGTMLGTCGLLKNENIAKISGKSRWKCNRHGNLIVGRLFFLSFSLLIRYLSALPPASRRLWPGQHLVEPYPYRLGSWHVSVQSRNPFQSRKKSNKLLTERNLLQRSLHNSSGEDHDRSEFCGGLNEFDRTKDQLGEESLRVARIGIGFGHNTKSGNEKLGRFYRSIRETMHWSTTCGTNAHQIVKTITH